MDRPPHPRRRPRVAARLVFSTFFVSSYFFAFPAVGISSEPERGKILSSACNRYNALNAFSLGTAAATWFMGRAGSGQRYAARARRSAGLEKDSSTRDAVRHRDIAFSRRRSKERNRRKGGDHR